MKAHPVFGDSLLAGLIAAIDLLLFVGRSVANAQGQHIEPVPPPWYVAIPLIIGTVAPLAFRRKYPLVAAYLVLIVGIPHSVFELGLASLIGLCIAVYTLVTYVGRKPALLYVIANLVSGAVQLPLQAQ